MIAHKTILLDNVYSYLEVGAFNFKSVREFKFLGTRITDNNEIQEEIKTKM